MAEARVGMVVRSPLRPRALREFGAQAVGFRRTSISRRASEENVGETYITDMGHFLDGNSLPVGIPAPARRLAEYFGQIVAVATARAAGPEFASALPCRRRPRHHPHPSHCHARPR